ncbi:MAG: hypothetical protein V4549_07300 [Bacteroidota bacterium]
MTNFVKLSCNSFNPMPKPEKAVKAKKGLSYKKKPTGEKPVFEKIWAERGPYSEINGEFLGDFNVCYFLHILAKGKNKYPEFKLLEENIVLGSLKQHHDYDNARYRCVEAGWKKVFDKEVELKERYAVLYPPK